MDLHKLTNQDQGPAGADASAGQAAVRMAPPRRRWLTRIGVPGAVVCATLALVGYAARDMLLPAMQVEVTRAIAVGRAPADTAAVQAVAANGGASTSAPAAVVAQAPGWVEPDPYATYASALADGIVEKVLVLEGETVKAGQPLVKLVQEDAALALAGARAALAEQQAHLAAAQAMYDEPIGLIRAESVAAARLAGAEAALRRLDAEVAQQAARLAELTAAYDRLDALDERSVSVLAVDAAKYQMQSQAATVEATRQRRPVLEAAVTEAAAAHKAAKRDLELKIEAKHQLDERTATVEAATVRVTEAALRLERMTVVSPVDGVVMRRLTSPGAKVILMMDQPHSAHVVHLYDPAKLQVRVDVPLADAAAVGLGQRAQIVVDVLPEVTFTGVVTRLVHEADIAKNTVQFKVAIDDPSDLLKPDMLARVKFLGSGDADATTSSTQTLSAGTTRVAIEQSALIGGGESAVWWVSPIDSRVQRRAVVLGADLGDGRVVVREGLNPGDVVVDRPVDELAEGQRVWYGLAD